MLFNIFATAGDAAGVDPSSIQIPDGVSTPPLGPERRVHLLTPLSSPPLLSACQCSSDCQPLLDALNVSRTRPGLGDRGG